MRWTRCFSTTLRRNRLLAGSQGHIEHIIENVAARKNLPFLIDAYERRLAQHNKDSKDHSQLSPYNLKPKCEESLDSVRARRREIITSLPCVAPTDVYLAFLKALYPLRLPSSLNWGQPSNPHRLKGYENLRKYHNINHELLYLRFCALPRPAFLHMEPQHAEDFLDRFLARRDFNRPTVLSSTSKLQPFAVIRSYNNAIRKRTEYVNMCADVFAQLRQSGLPSLASEYNKLFYYVHHRDRRDIQKQVEDAIASCDAWVQPDRFVPREFNEDSYLQYREQFNIDQESAGMLAQLAFRHGNISLANMIVGEFGVQSAAVADVVMEASGELGSTEAIVHEKHALEYYSGAHIDIRSLNKLIRMLVQQDEIHLADGIVQIFRPTGSIATDPSYIVYKQTTAEDASVYEEVLRRYKRLTGALGEPVAYQLFPNENTFLPLVEYHAKQGQFDKMIHLMDIMEHGYGLPLTSRIFSPAFEAFCESDSHDDLAAERFRYLLSRLLNCHGYSYQVLEDTTLGDRAVTQVDPAMIQPTLASIVNREVPALPYDRGNFLKLRGHLVHTIFEAAKKLHWQDYTREDITKIQGMLDEKVLQIRAHTDWDSPNLARAVYEADGTIYARREALLELLEVILDVE